MSEPGGENQSSIPPADRVFTNVDTSPSTGVLQETSKPYGKLRRYTTAALATLAVLVPGAATTACGYEGPSEMTINMTDIPTTVPEAVMKSSRQMVDIDAPGGHRKGIIVQSKDNGRPPFVLTYASKEHAADTFNVNGQDLRGKPSKESESDGQFVRLDYKRDLNHSVDAVQMGDPDTLGPNSMVYTSFDTADESSRRVKAGEVFGKGSDGNLLVLVPDEKLPLGEHYEHRLQGESGSPMYGPDGKVIGLVEGGQSASAVELAKRFDLNLPNVPIADQRAPFPSVLVVKPLTSVDQLALSHN